MNNRKTAPDRSGANPWPFGNRIRQTTKAPGFAGASEAGSTVAYFSEVEIATKLLDSLLPTPLTAVMIAMAMPAAIRPYSMAVAPDSSLTKRETRFFIIDNSCVHVAGRTIIWSRRRSQHRDHGVTLRADHCGAVNSMAKKRREPALLTQSKRGIKRIDKMRKG